MPTVRLEQADPSGFRKALVWIKGEYNNPSVFVTENGYSDIHGLHDMERTKYFVVSEVNFINSNKTYQR
jgi:beta-glucosidase/6-phospho-beta-glucosidase/beta-galactosidase